jgi:hypothetical protein
MMLTMTMTLMLPRGIGIGVACSFFLYVFSYQHVAFAFVSFGSSSLPLSPSTFLPSPSSPCHLRHLISAVGNEIIPDCLSHFCHVVTLE